jgi:hypothetical protein
MAEVQTTYSEDLAVGYPGMIANGETSNRITRTCEDAGGIPFGVPVYRGAGDHGCTLTPGVGTLLGISIAHQALGFEEGDTVDEYKQYQNVAILTEGVIWVTAAEDVTDGVQAYGTAAGAIDDSSSGDTILTGWFFDTTASAGGLVKLAKR